MNPKRGITIFTPTFNRATTLPRLYESLVRQSCGEFEWLIVDDGSSDGTKKLVESYIQENKISINYIYKVNGGKHTAINVGLKNAAGEYFFCVDSDDFLEDNAILDIVTFIKQKNPVGIIAYKKETGHEDIIGAPFPDSLVKSTLFNLINNYKCGGDRSLIYKTQLIRQFVIPEPKGVKFFPVTYLYDCFDNQYECHLLPKSLCVCEYMEGGYSANFRMLMINNAVSMKWFYGHRIDLKCTLVQRYISAFRYVAYSLLSRSKEGKYCGKHKTLVCLSYPMGVAMYIVYAIFREKNK